MTATQTPPTPTPTLGTQRKVRSDRAAKSASTAEKAVIHAFLALAALVSLFPFYWLFAMSTNTSDQILSAKLSPGDQFGTNVRHLLDTIDIFGSMGNTLIVALASAVLVMFFDSLAAFTFAKYDFPGKNVLFVILLATFMIPASLSLVPSFTLMSYLGWVGQLKALIIPGMANAFGIFLLRQFAEGSIPNELIESARVDGASFWHQYWHVGMPMLRGGLAFLGIFTFIGQWNDYVWPLVVLINPHRQTLQVALSQLNSIYGTDYGMVMAGAVISVVPLLIVFIIGAKFFIDNIAAGAVKG